MASDIIRKLSLTEINQMNKEMLKNTLKEIVCNLEESPKSNEEGETDEDMKEMLKQVLVEVKATRTEKQKMQDNIDRIEQMLATQNKEIAGLKSCNANLLKTVSYHQKMLEQADYKERSCNAVITGVKEDIPLDGADSDIDKCKKIFDKIGVQTEFNVKRIGKPGTYPRPLLVMTKTPEARKNLLESAKKLKNAEECYKKIYY